MSLLVSVMGSFGLGAAVGLFLLPVIRPRNDFPRYAVFRRRWVLIPVGVGALFAAFAVALLQLHCQQTPEVRPEEFWRYGRLVSHLILLSLLLAANATDLRDYMIPDAITVPGMLVGVVGATVSGDLQIIHLWVDWNQPLTPIYGPYIPEWIRMHPHWHGLAWSLAGLLAGAGITWFVRVLARWILGRHALGFGDVTLMAMLGSFLGWQPILVVFLLAPILGVLIGAALRLISNRMFLPYTPCLGAAAIAVMFGWRWIWMFEIPWTSEGTFALRRLFGDWIGLAISGAMAVSALLIMLLLLRLYHSIPVTRRN